MNPRTFLPLPSPPIAPAPSVGEPAPNLPVAAQAGTPMIVAFLRHTGCPFAEATMQSMRERAGNAADGLRWVAVSHAPPDATDRWCSRVGGAGPVELVSDPGRTTYAAWGLGRTSLGHFLGPRSLSAAGRLAQRGVRNTHPHGTRWQSAGTFAIDGGQVVRWRHLPSHAGDLPDLDDAVKAVASR